MPKKANESAADAAQATDAADAATVTTATTNVAEDASVPTMLENITDAAQAAAADAAPVTVEPTADGSVELSPVATVQALIAKLDAALPALAGTPMETALLAQREELVGALALAEADAALVAERDSEETKARAAALEHGLPAELLDAMLRAIDAKYAPAEMPADVPAPTVPVNQTAGGKKPIGAVATERNLTVAAALATDETLAQRVRSAIAAWYGSPDDAACLTVKAAGTRYAGEVALGSLGAGVANRADYVVMATAIRMELEKTLKVGGQTVPDTTWLAALGGYPYAAKTPNGKDSLPLCFTDRRELAQYADGRFRLALPTASGVRFVHSDAGAYAAFNGGSATAATPAAPTAPVTPQAPRIPTPPTQAAAPSGAVVDTQRCVGCSAKNFVTDAACRACKREDWKAA